MAEPAADLTGATVIVAGARAMIDADGGGAMVNISSVSSLASHYITGQVLAVDGGMSVKLAMLGDDNAPVFVTDPEVRARMIGSDLP